MNSNLNLWIIFMRIGNVKIKEYIFKIINNSNNSDNNNNNNENEF